MAEEMIPKKEVLRLTGISYGQLYRWKRKGLIPEAWFIRRSTVTGQETFFPREKIFSRIAQIQERKEQSLDELARLLAPEAAPGEVCWDDPTLLAPIGPQGKALLWKEGGYTFPELVALAAGAETVRKGAKPAEARLLVDLLRAEEKLLQAPTGATALLAEKAIDREGISVRMPYACLGREPIQLDGESRVRLRLDLEKLVEEVKLALREVS
jgi:DNA-binding transcriptional MerR regulator